MTSLHSPLFHQGLRFDSAPALPYGPTYGNRVATRHLLRESWQSDTELVVAKTTAPAPASAASEQRARLAACG